LGGGVLDRLANEGAIAVDVGELGEYGCLELGAARGEVLAALGEQPLRART
jgi:hypothetical protein